MQIAPQDVDPKLLVTEERMNELFAHHGWKIIVPHWPHHPDDTQLLEPTQHEEPSEFPMSSRGHPLLVGSAQRS